MELLVKTNYGLDLNSYLICACGRDIKMIFESKDMA